MWVPRTNLSLIVAGFNKIGGSGGRVYFRMASGRRHGHGYLNQHDSIDRAVVGYYSVHGSNLSENGVFTLCDFRVSNGIS
ncbi:hypothetical protein VNO78_15252 [Psophocarpus tetragonolobus]|uniref:Uncharacterized protein n=1 Tax=Psophocarpus tetragonolobus TaxID=3891 RepID=A0AAN9SEP1_PSOTE